LRRFAHERDLICAPFNRFIEAVAWLFFARDGPDDPQSQGQFPFHFLKDTEYETRNQIV
jgi:hypothetical protein